MSILVWGKISPILFISPCNIILLFIASIALDTASLAAFLRLIIKVSVKLSILLLSRSYI